MNTFAFLLALVVTVGYYFYTIKKERAKKAVSLNEKHCGKG